MKVNELNDFLEIEKIAKTYQKEKQAYMYSGNKLAVITPSAHFINIPEEECEIFELKYVGGSIVVFPQDIDIVVFADNAYDIIISLYKRLCRELHKKGYNAKINSNDLIVDDGDEYTKLAAMVSHFCHISVNTDTELVQSICKKRSEKIPGRLLDYGFTFEEIYDIILTELKGA